MTLSTEKRLTLSERLLEISLRQVGRDVRRQSHFSLVRAVPERRPVNRLVKFFCTHMQPPASHTCEK